MNEGNQFRSILSLQPASVADTGNLVVLGWYQAQIFLSGGQMKIFGINWYLQFILLKKKYDRLNICAIRPKITEKSSIAKEQLDGILNQHLKVICKFHCRVFFLTNYILTAGLS